MVVLSALIAHSVGASLSATTKTLPGGLIDADPNSPAVKQAVDFAYAKISASLNTAHALQLGKVVKAQSQVVSGVKYYLTIEVNETDCSKSVTDLSHCKVAVSPVLRVNIVSPLSDHC